MGMKKAAQCSETDKHADQITSLFFYKGRLFSSANDGYIKVWSPDLKLITSFQAHPVNVYSAAILNDTIYSCSNDGTIQSWDANDFQKKKTIFQDSTSDTTKLHVSGGKLFSGSDQGVVQAWENDELSGRYETMEEIWDLLVIENTLYTARCLDVVVTEMKPGSKSSCSVRGTIEGHSPIRRLGDLICFLSRDAKTLLVHDSSSKTGFAKKAEIKLSNDLLVNELLALGDTTVLSGGYDKLVNKWDVSAQKNIGSVDVGGTIVSFTSSQDANDVIFAGTDTGHVIRVDSV
ncbi:unnamed protein product [Bemisia tabaci]|uniref:Uncharacterized protein n=1 Tax=Bemisia tabaci TaxID=7038 RepID=A0A9P0AGM9_BEMTA|nr:unnamed protein product [Bemisia tabaci]